MHLIALECVLNNTCQNDAVCIEDNPSHRCVCSEGFTGPTCATGMLIRSDYCSYNLWHTELTL